jgi:hypothetical protein
MRTTRNLIPEISDDQLHFLSDGLLGEAQEKRSLKLFLLQGNENAARELWNIHKESILQEWIRENPGTRPSLWWRFSAPRISDESISPLGRGATVVRLHRNDFCEPRLRLGGIGTPDFQDLNYWPRFEFGIPAGWVQQWQVETYNGRSRDVRGDLIPCEWKEGHFLGLPIDPNDLPKFESQAQYLRRHSLLEPGEEKRLKARDYEPEMVPVPVEDQEEVTIQ